MHFFLFILSFKLLSKLCIEIYVLMLWECNIRKRFLGLELYKLSFKNLFSDRTRILYQDAEQKKEQRKCFMFHLYCTFLCLVGWNNSPRFNLLVDASFHVLNVSVIIVYDVWTLSCGKMPSSMVLC